MKYIFTTDILRKSNPYGIHRNIHYLVNEDNKKIYEISYHISSGADGDIYAVKKGEKYYAMKISPEIPNNNELKIMKELGKKLNDSEKYFFPILIEDFQLENFYPENFRSYNIVKNYVKMEILESAKNKKAIEKLIKPISYGNNIIGFVMSMYSTTLSTYIYLKKEKFIFKKFIFPIIVPLYILQKHNIFHSDLHLNNIMIGRVNNVENKCIKIFGNLYGYTLSQFTLRIIDFSRATTLTDYERIYKYYESYFHTLKPKELIISRFKKYPEYAGMLDLWKVLHELKKNIRDIYLNVMYKKITIQLLRELYTNPTPLITLEYIIKNATIMDPNDCVTIYDIDQIKLV